MGMTHYINFLTSTFIFWSSFAKVKVKQKENVNFLKDYNHPPVLFSSDATDLVIQELVLKKVFNKI